MARVLGQCRWVLLKGYPKLAGENGAETLTVKYRCTLTELDTLPRYGALYENLDIPFFSQFSTLTLKSRSVDTLADKQAYEVTLVYATDDEDGANQEPIVYTRYEMVSQDQSPPIEQHSDYRTHWNNNLLAKLEIGDVPGWWENLATKLIPASDAENYKWAPLNTPPPDGWYVIRAATKPAVNSFMAGSIVVQMVKSCANLTVLARESDAHDYTRQTPGTTFNRALQWYRGGSRISYDNKNWVLTVSYYGNKELDPDIYK